MIHTLATALAALTLASFAASTANAETPSGRVIPIAATYGSPQSGRIALFLSGDGGWNLGVVSMAKSVAQQGYFVAGIDFPKYLKERDGRAEGCISIADDLAATASTLTHESDLLSGAPLLIGYSSGATGVYGALVQSHPGIFAGGLSLGFAPDLKTQHPFCTGAGLQAKADPKLGYIYASVPAMKTPWKALQGEIDQDVSASATHAFVSRISNAKIIMLPKVGHGFSVEKNWMPQFTAALRSLEHTPQTH